jgi:hypothetical protein
MLQAQLLAAGRGGALPQGVLQELPRAGGLAPLRGQGTGADGLKLALALLWERREEAPGAFPVLAVHDEIVIECDEAKAER